MKKPSSQTTSESKSLGSKGAARVVGTLVETVSARATDANDVTSPVKV